MEAPLHSSPASGLADRESTEPPSAEQVVQAVRDMLMRSSFESEALPEALRQVAGMEELHALLWGIRHMVCALSRGDLHHLCRQKGFVVGALKALQSDLRHLTWQVQCVAKGEYQHRVNFMGDFSTAFNMMVEELDKNVSELTKLSHKYKELSCKDPLTGLLNRRAFVSLAIDALKRSVDKDMPVSVIMADIDYFKNINDTYGHACGDDVLRHFADKVASFLRSMDICCRYGGEEFLLLLPGSPLQSGTVVAERLRQAVEQMDVLSDSMKISITASFGVSELRPRSGAENLTELLEAGIEEADRCLYKAKNTGRNRVISGTPRHTPQAAPDPLRTMASYS